LRKEKSFKLFAAAAARFLDEARNARKQRKQKEMKERKGNFIRLEVSAD